MKPIVIKRLPLWAVLLMAPVVWAQTPLHTPAPSPSPGVKNYKFKVVNPPGAAETSVRGINNQEVYVGDTATEAQVVTFTENGFVAKDSTLKQFSVPASFGAADTDAQDINNRNVILGMFDIRHTPSQSTDADHGFVLDEKGFHKLPDPDTTKYEAFPDWNGLNNENEIVGTVVSIASGNGQGFILENGKYKYYTPPAPYVELEFNGLNDREAVVGEVIDTNNNGHGVLFKRGQFFVFDFPGAAETIAFDVNNQGDIVGSYTDATTRDHGFLLKDFPEHPKWFTIDSDNPTYPETTIRSINDEGDIGGVISVLSPVSGPHTEVGFVAEPK
jgi:hypothetical protein